MTADAKPAVEPIGVVDIGANSVRLEIAQVFSDASVEVLERARLPVRLGQDTFVKRSLSRRSMNAAISILRGHREMLDAYKVKTIRAVATSAVREADNADAFLDRIFMTTGLEVEIIEPAEEARLTVMAVRNAVGAKFFGKQTALLTEVGGGSAMIAMLRRGQIVSSGSYALGSIRLQESLDIVRETPGRVADMLRQQIGSVVSAMSSTLPLAKAKLLVAVGGDARFAAEQVGTAGPGEHLLTMSRKDFDAFVDTISHHAAEDLAREYKLPFAEAETIVPALLVYQDLLEHTQAEQLLVTDVSMRDGLLRDMAMRATGQADKETATSAIRSAETLATKYHCDMKHAQHVATLSLQLFDAFQNEHRLAPRHRLLLHVAGLVHEVGGFINGRAHHKHGYYILANSEIFGLRGGEQEIVANVARYHRRNTPRPSHAPYMSLPRERRVVVCKLAALLRIADALERGHNQQVRKITVQRQGDEVVLHIEGATDLALERKALENKVNLFEDIYGMHVRVEEK
jgi:exopolyphosphatase/guanosine-5'-triphosphate,3'-diphosphate pyrophosphatase